MRKTKKYYAEVLKRFGYFSKYRYVCDIVKDYTWADLKMYYKEMIQNR